VFESLFQARKVGSLYLIFTNVSV